MGSRSNNLGEVSRGNGIATSNESTKKSQNKNN